MAWTLYWVVCPSADAGYADSDTDAAKIKNGQNAAGTALPAGTYGSLASPTTAGANQVDATSPPTTQLSEATLYKIAWTIEEGGVYGGGTANKVEISDAFWTLNVGDLAATESGSDTAAMAGAVLVSGSLAVTESGSDTAALAGAVLVSGSLAATESGADTAALAGAVLVSGSLAVIESGSDTAAIYGTGAAPAITGTLAATETGADTAAVSGAVLVAGLLAAVETGVDTAALAGQIRISGTFAAVETGSDTAALRSTVSIPVSTLPTWYYQPGALPLDAPPWLARELMSISRATYGAAPYLQMQVAYVAPAKPRDGMIVLAAAGVLDTNAGVYARIGGAWVQL